MTTEEKIKELENQIEKLKKEEEMEQWFKSLLNGLKIVINDNKPNSVLYCKDGNYLFDLYQDSNKQKYFYCNYYLVWSVFTDKYNLKHYETRVFIENMVEQHLKLGVIMPKWRLFDLPC
jgi:hypothetical protein